MEEWPLGTFGSHKLRTGSIDPSAPTSVLFCSILGCVLTVQEVTISRVPQLSQSYVLMHVALCLPTVSSSSGNSSTFLILANVVELFLKTTNKANKQTKQTIKSTESTVGNRGQPTAE